MRIKKGISIILIFALIVSLSGCSANSTQIPTLVVEDYNGIDLSEIDHYNIKVDFDPANRIYSADQKVTYVNNTGKDLDKLFFHLYPNAYKSAETAPILFDGQNLSKDEFIPGHMEIEKVKIGKKEVDYRIGGIVQLRIVNR